MKKVTKIIISIVIIVLIIALSIMTYLYFDMKDIVKENQNTTIRLAEENWKKDCELNDKIAELEEKLENTSSGIQVDSKGNSNNQVGDTFYATIQSIDKNNEGMIMLTVSGLEVNDANTRGDFRFIIKDTTDLIWMNTRIEPEELKVGQNISITYNGSINETSPAVLNNVIKVKLLNK